ncbi:M28 family peptidase [Algoriphagus lutimaris]|uniref:M28 family peptidase n=1 Tax=Algoriphagus lutimaris TaxID=613197 RepID=UPI00196AD54B|nr:M28 family peptidase [Algoriphagus lutimaris]MBN3519993.1 M28 family peptidase [Algoriphagus lutimaris]
MQKLSILCLFLFIQSVSVFSQNKDLFQTTNSYFELVRPKFEGKEAYETVAFVEKYWRVAGNTGFNNTVYRISSKLEEAGYVLEKNATSEDRLTFRIETRKMERPTWEPVDGSIQIIGQTEKLLDFSTNRHLMYQYSSSTPKEGITAEVIYVENKKALKDLDVEGKIIFAGEGGYRAFQSAVKEGGALGIFTYDMPDYLQPKKNTTSIQFRSLRYDAKKPTWAVALSYEAKEKLKAALEKGPVSVHVNIQTKIYDSEELTVVANVKGSELPMESLVFSAHIQEPGANDNATGVGTQLEMAQITADLIQKGELNLKRTLTFLWGDEIISTRRYIEEEEKREPKINWGISLDMVGENTEVTGGTFLIEKMPDPSAIWTRGEDQHSEWGGRPLEKEDMKPHYLNDFMIYVFEEQGAYANWVVKTNPFEGGSDHTPFLRADIPGLLLWHFTDQFYHTDQDRLDKVSQNTMVNVGTAALVSAYTLLNGGNQTAEGMIALISASAQKRLTTEFKLSKKAITEGASKEDEQLILDTWADYYAKAMDSIKDLVPADDEGTLRRITLAKEAIKAKVPQL